MPAPALVICDGGLASTVGARLEAERCPPIAWVPPASSGLLPPQGVAHEQVLRIVRRQADLHGYATVVDAGDAGSDDGVVGPLALPMTLIAALRAAMAHGCDRVVWPAACGHDLDEMSAVAERALLVTRLAWLEEGSLTGQAPHVDTPLVDLSERALDDLARDLDLDPETWIDTRVDARGQALP